MEDAYITLGLALVVLAWFALTVVGADLYGWWRDRRTDEWADAVRRAAEGREALGRTVGRRGR